MSLTSVFCFFRKVILSNFSAEHLFLVRMLLPAWIKSFIKFFAEKVNGGRGVALMPFPFFRQGNRIGENGVDENNQGRELIRLVKTIWFAELFGLVKAIQFAELLGFTKTIEFVEPIRLFRAIGCFQAPECFCVLWVCQQYDRIHCYINFVIIEKWLQFP